jgi:hypothetical protein
VTFINIMDVVFYLWYCGVMFHLLSLKSHSFAKVSHCSFLVTTRKVISRKSCPGGRVSEGHDWDDTPWGQLLVN